MQVKVLLKEDGGFAVSPWEFPIEIIRGQQAKLAMIVIDSVGRAVTTTAYDFELKIRNQDETLTTLTATDIDNSKGEAEFLITPTASLLFKLGSLQTIEVKIVSASDPTIVTYFRILSALTVADKALS